MLLDRYPYSRRKMLQLYIPWSDVDVVYSKSRIIHWLNCPIRNKQHNRFCSFVRSHVTHPDQERRGNNHTWNVQRISKSKEVHVLKQNVRDAANEKTSNIIRSLNDKTIDLIYVALVLEKKTNWKKTLPYPCVQSTLTLQRNQNLKQHLPLMVIFPHEKKSWKEQEAHHVNKFLQIRVLI